MSRPRGSRAKRARMQFPALFENLRARLAAGWGRRAVSLKALSFATVGLINTAVDAAASFLMLGFGTSSLGVANVTGWLIAVTGSYVMNSYTTLSAETRGNCPPKHPLGCGAPRPLS